MSYDAYVPRPRSGYGIVLLCGSSRGSGEETAELAVVMMMILTQSTDRTALSRQPSQSHPLCPYSRVDTGLGLCIDGVTLSIEGTAGYLCSVYCAGCLWELQR